MLLRLGLNVHCTDDMIALDIQTGRQAEKQTTYKQLCKQTDSQTDRDIDRQTDSTDGMKSIP